MANTRNYATHENNDNNNANPPPPPTLEQDIQKGQLEEAKIQEIKEQIKEDKAPEFSIDEKGTLWYKKHLCIPEVKEIRELILREAHDSTYSIHPGSTKIYHDLKSRYWWME
jgi:hypothetical protein